MLESIRKFFAKTEASDNALYSCFRLLVRVEGFRPNIYMLPSKFPLAGATFGLGIDVGQWKREELERVIGRNWDWAVDFIFKFPQVFEVHYTLRELADKSAFTKEPKTWLSKQFELDREALLGAVKNFYLVKNPELRKTKLPASSFTSALPVSLAVLKYFVTSFLEVERKFPEVYLPIAIGICWQNGISGGRKRYSNVFTAMRMGDEEGLIKKIQTNITFGSFSERWKVYLQWINSEVNNAD